MMGLLIQIALSTAVGLLTGFAGARLAAPADEASALPAEAPVMPLAEVPGAAAIVDLPAITTNLADPGAWARLELSLVFAAKPDAETANLVHADALAYLRTLGVHQIASPSGYLFMRSDLKSRASDLTDGAVRDVLVRGFLIE